MELVDNPDTFVKHFRLVWTNGQTARGGLRNGNPGVWMPQGDRYWNRNNYVAYLASCNYSHKFNWNRAVNHAKEDRWYHVEYHRIMDCPFIGGFVSDEVSHHVMATLCHEVAHAIDYWNAWLQRRRGSSHGQPWRDIYATLRHELLNEFLPPQPWDQHHARWDHEFKQQRHRERRLRYQEELEWSERSGEY
jgi:hypothetical protein